MSCQPIGKQLVWSPGSGQRSEFASCGSHLEEDAEEKSEVNTSKDAETLSNLSEDALVEPGLV